MADELIALFGKITTTDHDQLVDQFSKILQVDQNVATFYLEASSWNVETAVHNYLASTAAGAGGASPVQNRTDGRRPMMQPLTSPPQAVFAGDLAPWQSRPFLPGTKLPIRLRFQNTGNAAWPSDSRLAFVDGDRMGGFPDTAVFAKPGEAVELVLVLSVPNNEGTHMGSWRLCCQAGYFGDPIYMIVSSSPNAEPVQFPPSEYGQRYQEYMQQQLMRQQQVLQRQQQHQQQNPSMMMDQGGGQVDQLIGSLHIDQHPNMNNQQQQQQQAMQMQQVPPQPFQQQRQDDGDDSMADL